MIWPPIYTLVMGFLLIIWTGIPPMAFSQEPLAHRIAVRTVEGAAQFYDTVTGERFVPRGVNYVDFQPIGRGRYEDRVFATNTYNPERVKTAFRLLASHGYNTVRIFIDTCGAGPSCMGNPGGPGLNPPYLDNIVDVMRIAGEEGVYLLLTANAVPSEGGYWPYFDSRYYGDTPNPFFEAGHLNGAYMVEEGFETHRRYWRDLMQGLVVERSAPTEVLLGWQLFNEHWFFGDKPPFTLNQGLIELPFGVYDLAEADQKRQMGVDATLHMIRELVPIVRAADPDTLITMGFFAPDFPNPAYIGGPWDTDTEPLLHNAPLDFFDFHAYADLELTIRQQAENFGMIGYTEKPIIMGETGIGKIAAFSAQSAAALQAAWNAESCQFGFQGWLQWAYYAWPTDLDGAAWAFLDTDGFMLEALSPGKQPDPCQPVELVEHNLAYRSRVTYSSQVPAEPASQAVDGTLRQYCPEGYPPQWIQVNLAQPAAIARIAGADASWPASNKRVQVWARLANGTDVLLVEFSGFMRKGHILEYDLPGALPDVSAVRFLTLEGGAWPCWFDLEVLSAALDAPVACLITPRSGTANLRAQPRTDADLVSSMTAGQGALADGQISGADGLVWWRLTRGAWVRSDVVRASEACDGLEAVAA